jgi:hypothetical protein
MHRSALSIAILTGVTLGATWLLAQQLEDTFYIPLDHPAIQYAERPANDPVARLAARMKSGQVKLSTAPNGLGYLPTVLKELGVNVDSQVLVFSKTSTQAERISPRTPRAIYFNDDVSVGYVRDSDILEFSALDPQQGVKFYVLAASSQPEFARSNGCLNCHQGAITLGVPGLMVSSIHPASDEARAMHGSSFVTDQRTPLNERWGGWYVTGTHGSQYHLGNNLNLVDPVHPGPPSRQGTQNVTSLEGKFDLSKYLAPTSDLVALMTLEHQTRMTNLMIRIGWDARIAQQERKTPAATRNTIDSEIDQMVKYMLFMDEAPLTSPVAGVSSFTKTFPQRGPRDSQARSLRDFDLKTRLFRYPLSYMIYSAAFDGLPDTVRERVYQRLYDILTGKDETKISSADRTAVLAIVRETKKNVPSYWRTPPTQ